MSDPESDNWESASESGDEIISYWVKLDDIDTIGALYKKGVLKAPTPASSSLGSGSGDSTSDAPDAPADASGSTTTHRQYGANASLLDRVSLFQGDITRIAVDSIVNAANKSLLGGGGVDGAIHNAAGPKLLAECRQLNGARTGESKMTKGYDLPSRYVIHTVGPVYNEKEKAEKARLLESCYKTSLSLAADNRLKHIAFPSISTGIYGYPIYDATHVALKTTREFLDGINGDKLDRVIFVVWSSADKATYEALIPEYFPPMTQTESAPNGEEKE